MHQSVCSPAVWHRTLEGSAKAGGVCDHLLADVKHFVDVPGAIEQPPLNAHVVALHLGGAKRVRRAQGKRNWVQDVALGSITLMPAYQANRWHTEGPIDFAHLLISVGTAEQIIVEEFDREPSSHQLHDTIGIEDPLLEQVFRAILSQVDGATFSQLHMDALLMVFTVSLLERYSTICARKSGVAYSPGQRRGGLAGWQLRRVIDHMQAHMHEDMRLSALAGLIGLSRAHFFRAFRQSTGRSPGQFQAGMRMRHAMEMLGASGLPVEDIAIASGFSHARHFASAFTKYVGVSPRLFRVSRE